MPIWCTRGGEHIFQRKNRFWMHCSELFAKQGWSIGFWLGDLITFSLRFCFWQTQPEDDVIWHQLSPLAANQCIWIFVCFSLVVSPLIGASSQLWSDSKLEQTWTWLPLTLDVVLVTILRTGLPILVFVSSSIASCDCYCFCIPSPPSFCFVDFEQIFGIQFSNN